MTMLTRCAACATTFRLTTEQLVSRQGMVRCGHCNEVFNALENLIGPKADDAGEPGSPLAQPGDADHEEEAAPVDTATYDLFDPAAHPAEQAAPQPDAAPAYIPAATPSLLMGSVQPRTFPWWSSIAALAALAALVGQATYHFRDQVAARVPEAKPLLVQACAHLGCRVEPPVDSQAISIEASDLQADNANRAVLILTAVLRNRADFAQPLPLLELSLTDALDAPVARRILNPADYARASPAIAAAGEYQVRVYIDAAQVKANGYRLYAFYP